MLKPSGPILRLSERISLRVLVGAFIAVKNIIDSTEVCVDVDFEMIAVEVKGMDFKYAWLTTGIYRAPNYDMLAIERSTVRTLPKRNLTKRNILDGGLNLPHAVWKWDEKKASRIQAI